MVAVVAACKAGGKACVRGDARDLWWPRNSVTSKPMITYQRLIQHNRKWQVLQVYNSSPSISLLGLAVSVQPILPEARSPSFEELIDPGAAIPQKAVWWLPKIYDPVFRWWQKADEYVAFECSVLGSMDASVQEYAWETVLTLDNLKRMGEERRAKVIKLTIDVGTAIKLFIMFRLQGPCVGSHWNSPTFSSPCNSHAHSSITQQDPPRWALSQSPQLNCITLRSFLAVDEFHWRWIGCFNHPNSVRT